MSNMEPGDRRTSLNGRKKEETKHWGKTKKKRKKKGAWKKNRRSSAPPRWGIKVGLWDQKLLN